MARMLMRGMPRLVRLMVALLAMGSKPATGKFVSALISVNVKTVGVSCACAGARRVGAPTQKITQMKLSRVTRTRAIISITNSGAGCHQV